MSDKLLSPEVYRAWLEANAAKKDSPDYKAVQKAYEAAAPFPGKEKAKEIWNDPNTSPVERLRLLYTSPKANAVVRALAPAGYAMAKGKEMAMSGGIRGVPAAAGQVVGQMAGGNLGGRIGAGVGALAGSIADQIRLRGTGGVKLGETAADVTAAAMNPRGVFKSAAVAAGLDSLQQLIDEGKVNPSRVATASAMAGAGAGIAKAGEKGSAMINPKDAKYFYRYRALQDVKPYGIVINPAEIERGIPLLNGIAGNGALSSDAAHLNQNGYQRMMRDAAGLEIDPKKLKGNSLSFEPSTRRYGIDLEDGELDREVKKLSEPYREISQISKDIQKEIELQAKQNLTSPKYLTSSVNKAGIEAMQSAEANLRSLRSARREMKAQFAKMDAGDPNARQELNRLKSIEDDLEGKLELAAQSAGVANASHKDLLDRLKDSRQKIAVVKAIDNATDTNGLVSPRMLSLQRQGGAALTGNLEKLALFYDAFQESGRNAMEAGVNSGTGAGVNYMLRNLAVGKPAGAIAGGVPIIGQALRERILSEKNQARFVNPRLAESAVTPAGTLLRQSSMLAGLSGQPEDGQ